MTYLFLSYNIHTCLHSATLTWPKCVLWKCKKFKEPMKCCWTIAVCVLLWKGKTSMSTNMVLNNRPFWYAWTASKKHLKTFWPILVSRPFRFLSQSARAHTHTVPGLQIVKRWNSKGFTHEVFLLVSSGHYWWSEPNFFACFVAFTVGLQSISVIPPTMLVAITSTNQCYKECDLMDSNQWASW